MRHFLVGACVFVFYFFSAMDCRADITTGLVGWWKLDEGFGTSATDSSGNGNTGTIYNSPTWEAGKSGWALSLNGTSQYVDIPSSLNQAGGLSISFWINIPSGGEPQFSRIVSNLTASPYNGYEVYVNKNGDTEIELQGGHGGALPQCNTTTSVGKSAWHQVIITLSTVSSGTVTIYFDGAAQSTAGNCSASMTIANSTDDMNIARFPGNGASFFTGGIDDVRFYSRALSAADVTQLYHYGYGIHSIRFSHAHMANLKTNYF